VTAWVKEAWGGIAQTGVADPTQDIPTLAGRDGLGVLGEMGRPCGLGVVDELDDRLLRVGSPQAFVTDDELDHVAAGGCLLNSVIDLLLGPLNIDHVITGIRPLLVAASADAEPGIPSCLDVIAVGILDIREVPPHEGALSVSGNAENCAATGVSSAVACSRVWVL
jgi:hypothetical protein